MLIAFATAYARLLTCSLVKMLLTCFFPCVRSGQYVANLPRGLIGGRKISDQEQVLNLAESSKQRLVLVKPGQFATNKDTFVELHGLVARNKSLEWGHFQLPFHDEWHPDVGRHRRD